MTSRTHPQSDVCTNLHNDAPGPEYQAGAHLVRARAGPHAIVSRVLVRAVPGGWSDAEIKRAIMQGARAFGTRLKPPIDFSVR